MKIKALCVALALVLAAPAAHARALAEIVALNWEGTAVQPADFTESGKVVVAERLSMTLDDANNIRGTAWSTFTLDGTTYRATYDVTGTYLPDEQAMRYSTGLPRTSDRLPNGLDWCGASGTLKFFNDSDRAGHFILRGTLQASCGGSVEVELVDR